MAVPPSSSSSSVTNEFKYDVYLSFRGVDTRYGFTGILYDALHRKGIHTFMDNEELQVGKEIAPSLAKAIEESKIAIVVLSENYASSRFCLEELCKILDCRNENGLLVLPVFYKVEPSDVGKLTGTYGQTMAKREARFTDNVDMLQKWKNALVQVANLPGFHYKHGNEYEYQLIWRIVQDVCSKLDRAPPLHADEGYLVGLESRLKEVFSLLELESNEVLLFGIHGIGGIGKSALTRAIYNRIAGQFEGSCFLDSVRENSEKYGLVHLQNMLLSQLLEEKDIQLGNVNKGVSMIKRSLHQKKVLLVLDDVDKLEQLEALVGGLDWFGSGSRVIITTRDKHLLTFHGVERIYEVQALNHTDALELLSHNVFRQGKVDPNYAELLNEVVTFSSGLPLALKVIGINLFGKSVDQSRYAVDRFKKIPHNDIQRILRVSFDALGKDEQSVFLDIMCCFKGYELVEIEDILCAHRGENAKNYIKVLIDKSLISISSDGKVTVHPLIEGMGKEIVRRESPIEPGKRSRLWHPEDILQVLKENTGTNRIEIIHLDSPLIEDEEVIEWDGETFKKMKNLRTLIIRNCHFSKAPNHLPDSLRVLKWSRYPSSVLPSDFETSKLDICEVEFRTPEDSPSSENVPSQSSPSASEASQTPHAAPASSQTPHAAPASQGVDPVIPPNSRRVFQVEANRRTAGHFQSVFQVEAMRRTAGHLPAPQGDDPSVLQILRSVFEAEMTWRIVFYVSSVVGLICYSLSPSFNCLIRRSKSFKFILEGVVCFVLFIILFGKECTRSIRNYGLLVNFIKFVVLMATSVISFYEDKVKCGNPGILDLVSNAAFAFMSLSLSRMINTDFELGVTTTFLAKIVVQLLEIDWNLIWVALVLDVLLFFWRSPKEAGNAGRANQYAVARAQV